jgi:hypothetical protein
MFFYLEWNDKRPKSIELLVEKPTKLTFESVFIVEGTEHVICGSINPNFMNYYPPVKLEYKKNQYLMSHLQKCIRRMDDVKSVKTAKHLLDLDCTSFLRRLPIIMLEDVTLHDSFPILIWLMIAHSKKFEMKQEIVKWLLGVVYHLATLNDVTFYSNTEIEEIEIGDTADILLNTLRFRKAYGGMTGDMNMIEYYTHLLYHNKLESANCKVPLVKLDMEPLLKKEWIYQANDFHCNRSIISQIQRHYPKYTKEYLKLLLWNFSSSQNNRIHISKRDKKQSEEWAKIERVVRKIQKACIFY